MQFLYKVCPSCSVRGTFPFKRPVYLPNYVDVGSIVEVLGDAFICFQVKKDKVYNLQIFNLQRNVHLWYHFYYFLNFNIVVKDIIKESMLPVDIH